MGEINFIELATFCQNEKREVYEKMANTDYVHTIFAAITEDNKVLTSRTAHILSNAHKCILIHVRSTRAISNWYNWYDVQFINEHGQVLEDALDDEFSLEICICGGYAYQRLGLCADGMQYYSVEMPCDNTIAKIWNLYISLKEAKTKTERKLISDLFQKDETILELKKEVEDFKFKTQLLEDEKAMYKELIKEIQSIVKQDSQTRPLCCTLAHSEYNFALVKLYTIV